MSMPYFSREALQNIAGDPHFVGGPLRAFAENLELPLALGHFGVDAFMVDAGVKADVEMLLDDLAGDIADVLVADAGIIRALRSGITAFREAERTTVLIKEIFLLKSEPGAGIVQDRGAGVRGVRRDAVRHHHFAHDERAILAGAVGVKRRPASERSQSFFLQPASSNCHRNPRAEAVPAWGSRRIP